MRERNGPAILCGLFAGLTMMHGLMCQAGTTPDQKVGTVAWSVNAPCRGAGNAGGFVRGITAKGNLLVSCVVSRSDRRFCSLVDWTNCLPEMVLLRGDDGAVVSRKVLHKWGGFLDSHRSRLYGGFSPRFPSYGSALLPGLSLLRRPNAALLEQVPWFAVVDLETGSIARPILPSPDLTDPKSPGLLRSIDTPTPMAVAVSPAHGKIAVASNLGTEPRLFIFNQNLTKEIRSWALPRYVKGVAWSHDGKRIAVLYDGKFDSKGKFVGEFPQWMPVRLPDVAVFDATTGAKLVSFFTGGLQAEIAFSPDGSLIYAISETTNVIKLHKYAVRVFSSTTGKLVRVIRPRGPRVHDEFAISPNGHFIAANASTDLPHPFWTEPAPFSNVTRVVLLDAKTGKVLFQHKRKIGLAFPLNPIFTPDGRLLIVQYGPYFSAKGKQRQYGHIVAYSLVGR